MSLKPIKYILILFAWFLIGWKAFHASMTYDESVTVFYIQDANIWPWLFDNTQWPNANNHWLNTILMQWSTGIFGNGELAIRLFNVLSFGVYGYFVYKISEKIENRYLEFAFILLMCGNPYLNDFFSTVRGYCFSVTFLTGMLYYISQYYEHNRPRDLYYAVASAYVSTLSMLSSLIFIPAIGISYLILTYYKNNTYEVMKRKEVIGAIIALFLLVILTYIPITSLSKSEEFKWGVTTFLESFTSLMRNIAYSRKYVPDHKFLVGIITMAMFVSAISLVSSSKNNLKTIAQLSILSFILVLCLMTISKLVFNTLYPVDRKTIVFIPFITIILIAGLSQCSEYFKKYTSMIICIVITYHFIASYNPKSIQEWWYDSDTKNMASIIYRDASKKVTVATNWMFKPTLIFYKKYAFSDKIDINENSAIDSTNTFDYYICFDSDMHLLQHKYNVFYRNSMGIQILKKK